MKSAALALLLPLMTQAANYTARKATVDGIEVVQLADAASRTEVSIAPSIGNMAYEIKVGGKNILWFPYKSPAELKAKPQFCGIPFLAPWANRLDGDAYWANGMKYLLNPGLGNFRRDGHQKPIHGLLNYSPDWEVVSLVADDRSASVTSRLEFAKHPEMMAQFPYRPYHQHDAHPGGRRGSSGYRDRQSIRRTATGRHRVPPLFSPRRCPARPMEGAPRGAGPHDPQRPVDSHRRT